MLSLMTVMSSQTQPRYTLSVILTSLAMLVDGPHFQATDDGELVFLLSDGDNSRRPTEHETLELEEESGTVRENYYLRVPLDHPDSHRWRVEIAKYLAPLVLGSTYNSLTTTTRRIYAPLLSHPILTHGSFSDTISPQTSVPRPPTSPSNLPVI